MNDILELHEYFSFEDALKMLNQAEKIHILIQQVDDLEWQLKTDDDLINEREFNLSLYNTPCLIETKGIHEFLRGYGGFPREYYLRQEEIQVFSLFPNLIKEQDIDASAVIIGMPGAGKSTLLMLVSFYYARIKRQIILIVRKSRVDGLVYIYLSHKKGIFLKGKIFDMNKIAEILRTFENAWVFLDSFSNEEVNRSFTFSLLRPFRLLTKSVAYDRKSNHPAEIILLPSWRFKNLLAYAQQADHWIMKDPCSSSHEQDKTVEILARRQYYYSGGSILEFSRTLEDCENRSHIALYRGISTDIHMYAITESFCMDGLDDRLYGIYIQDIYDWKLFMHSMNWYACFDSGYKLEVIATKRNHHQFKARKKLFEYTKVMTLDKEENDGGLCDTIYRLCEAEEN